MTKALLCMLFLACLFTAGGCSLFRKRPKESRAIASEVEETFRQRWMAQRISQLTAQGQTQENAQNQADAEFRERYPFAVPNR